MPSTVTFTVAVDRDIIASAIISAIEHGIYYWARDVEGIIPASVLVDITDEQRAELEEWGSIPFAALTPGCHVELIEHGGEGASTPRRFDHVRIEAALGTMATKYPRCFGIVHTGGDSASGDVLVQLAVLSEVVYG